MRNIQKIVPDEPQKEAIFIDFQKLFSKLLSNWWLFVLCVAMAYAAGQIYLRYVNFEYSSNAILLIKDAGRSGKISTKDILLNEKSVLNRKSMDNEIQILKSLTVMEKVVDRLGLNVSYFRMGSLKETELYEASPFILDSFQLNSGVGYANYIIELDDYKSFLLKKNEEDEGLKCYFGKPFTTDKGSFLMKLSSYNAIIKGTHRLEVKSLEAAANFYRFNIQIERIGDQNQSSVLKLSIINPVAKKCSDIINTLIDVYNEEEIKDKKVVLETTLDFIDNRVRNLVLELDSVELGIQRFKSNNKIISDNASSSMNYALGEIRSALQQASSYEVQQSLLTSLEDFLVNEKADKELIPANLIAENPVLSSFVSQYNESVLRYRQLNRTASEQNPNVISLDTQIIEIRSLILETIRNLRKDLQIPIKEVEQNIAKLRSSISSVPGVEKQLVERIRTQTIKENLFLYLLEKREETALSSAITTAKTRIIDRARIPSYPIYPKRKLIRMASILIGLLIPFVFLFLRSLLETKIETEETIKQLTAIPVLGRIALNKKKESIVVKDGSRSSINEMFRSLRTNFNFISQNKPNQVVMLTSSISGEGKTFIAINLGITLALSGKRVILLGMDLRKPKLATYINQKTGKGISNFLIGQNELKDIVQQFEGNDNLFFIPSGPIPPNPAELLMTDKLKELVTTLSQDFDYVLIDTPPVGLVSDALLLRPYVDNTLVVVRQNLTTRRMIANLQNMYSKKELEKVSIVFNGVKRQKGYYGYGGYYYGKKNSYYVED